MGYRILPFLICLAFAGDGLALTEAEELQKTKALEASIEAMSIEQGPFSTDLFEPLMELARLQLASQNIVVARDLLSRAQNIAHRNEGVYTPRQLEIVDLLTELAIADEDYLNANTLQKFEHFVQTHQLAPDDPALLEVEADMAEWFISTGQTRRARRLLAEAIDKTEARGQDPLPLAILLSKSRRLEGICCYSKELLAMLETGDSADPDTQARGYLELADTHLLNGKDDEARQYFARAFDISPLSTSVDPRPISARRVIGRQIPPRKKLLYVQEDFYNRKRFVPLTEEEAIEHPDFEPRWVIVDAENEQMGFTLPDSHDLHNQQRETQVLVGEPLRFSREQVSNLVRLGFRTRNQELQIEAAFTVAEDGNLEDIEIVSSTAPAKLDRLIVDALKKIHYRPALQDGVPVRTERVTLVQTFRQQVKKEQ